MTSKVQSYLQAERYVSECKNDPEVKRYIALKMEMRALEEGKIRIEPEKAVNAYLDSLPINKITHVFDIRNEVSEAAYFPHNRGLANIIRDRGDFTETREKINGNPVFIKARKVTA